MSTSRSATYTPQAPVKTVLSRGFTEAWIEEVSTAVVPKAARSLPCAREFRRIDSWRG